MQSDVENHMQEEWVYCPVCGGKTRIKIRKDTELNNFPIYCPKCLTACSVKFMRIMSMES